MKSTQSRSFDIVDTLPAGLVGAEALASGPGCELTLPAGLVRAEASRRLDSRGQIQVELQKCFVFRHLRKKRE